jgi:hypothetical protein
LTAWLITVEPVGGDPVAGAEDAPQRAGDQHAVPRKVREAKRCEQHAGVELGGGDCRGDPQARVDGVDQLLARLAQPWIDERREAHAAAAIERCLALGRGKQHEHEHETNGGRRMAATVTML